VLRVVRPWALPFVFFFFLRVVFAFESAKPEVTSTKLYTQSRAQRHTLLKRAHVALPFACRVLFVNPILPTSLHDRRVYATWD